MLPNKWLQRLFRHQQLSPVARPSICLPYLSLSLLRARYKRTLTVNERAPNGTYAIELLHGLPAPMLATRAGLPVSIPHLPVHAQLGPNLNQSDQASCPYSYLDSCAAVAMVHLRRLEVEHDQKHSVLAHDQGRGGDPRAGVTLGHLTGFGCRRPQTTDQARQPARDVVDAA